MSISSWNDPFDIFFSSRTNSTPRTNVGHNSKEIILQIELPGFSRSDIDLEVNASRLTVKASRTPVKTDHEFTTREINTASYSRTWSIPKNVNTDGVEAEYDAGILTVRLPINHTSRETSRKIELR